MKAILLVAVFFCLALYVQADGVVASNWATVDVKNGPGPLPRDAMAAQVFDDGIYTFGGFNENLDPSNFRPNIFYSDVWRFNTNSNRWTQRNPTPDAVNGSPPPRAYSIAGRYGDEMIVGFGFNYTATFDVISAYNDLWGYNTVTNHWRQIRANGTAGPVPRAETSVVVANGKIFMFGGATAQFSTKSDTWVYDFAADTWTQLTLTTKPSGRYGAVTILDSANNRMIIYGGEKTVFNLTTFQLDFVYAGPDGQWAFDFDSLTWSQMVPRANIPNRNNGNGGVIYNNQVMIFGGDIGGGSGCSNVIFDQNNVRETWIYDANINAWLQLCPTSSPPNLKRATTVLVGNTAYMMGGFAYDSTTCGPFIFPTDVYSFTFRGCYGGKPCDSA